MHLAKDERHQSFGHIMNLRNSGIGLLSKNIIVIGQKMYNGNVIKIRHANENMSGERMLSVFVC